MDDGNPATGPYRIILTPEAYAKINRALTRRGEPTLPELAAQDPARAYRMLLLLEEVILEGLEFDVSVGGSNPPTGPADIQIVVDTPVGFGDALRLRCEPTQRVMATVRSIP